DPARPSRPAACLARRGGGGDRHAGWLPHGGLPRADAPGRSRWPRDRHRGGAGPFRTAGGGLGGCAARRATAAGPARRHTLAAKSAQRHSGQPLASGGRPRRPGARDRGLVPQHAGAGHRRRSRPPGRVLLPDRLLDELECGEARRRLGLRHRPLVPGRHGWLGGRGLADRGTASGARGTV
ncbi:MAG: Rhodanese-related sulfurtransferase, partial [uncultured Craurococcus sp.]